MYKNGFRIYNLQCLMCHKTKSNQTKPNQDSGFTLNKIRIMGFTTGNTSKSIFQKIPGYTEVTEEDWYLA